MIMATSIMLACAGGMSSSLLVSKMKQAAKDQNLDVDIVAVGAAAVPYDIEKYKPEVVMLGPQVSYMLANIQKEVPVPVRVIDMRDYGTMNGAKVLATALNEIKAGPRMNKYRGSGQEPKDFDAFWQKGLAEMNAIDPNCQESPVDIPSNVADAYDLYFAGVGNARIHAELIRPKNFDDH
jgi:PTS system cellobiose-specific IIB component